MLHFASPAAPHVTLLDSSRRETKIPRTRSRHASRKHAAKPIDSLLARTRPLAPAGRVWAPLGTNAAPVYGMVFAIVVDTVPRYRYGEVAELCQLVEAHRPRRWRVGAALASPTTEPEGASPRAGEDGVGAGERAAGWLPSSEHRRTARMHTATYPSLDFFSHVFFLIETKGD